MKKCIICNLGEPYYVSDSLREDTEIIEAGILNGRSFRETARYVIEEYGVSNNLHNVEQTIIRHCKKCTAFSELCLFCNSTGDKVMSRLMVELMLKEGKPIEEIILTKDYFSLFADLNENPTSSKCIRGLEVHKKFCIPRYAKARKVSKEQEKEGGNGMGKVSSREEEVGIAVYA